MFAVIVSILSSTKTSVMSSFAWQLGALQEVLEKLQTKRLPMWEKKFGQVPTVHLLFCSPFDVHCRRGVFFVFVFVFTAKSISLSCASFSVTSGSSAR